MDDPFLNHVKQGLEKDWQEWNENLNEQQRQRQEELDRLTFQPQKGARQMTNRDYYDEENPLGFESYELEDHIQRRQKEAKMDQFLNQGTIQQRIKALEHKGIAKKAEEYGIDINDAYGIMNDPELYSVFESFREDKAAEALEIALRRKGIQKKPKQQPQQQRRATAQEMSDELRELDRIDRGKMSGEWMGDALERILPDNDPFTWYGDHSDKPPPKKKSRR